MKGDEVRWLSRDVRGFLSFQIPPEGEWRVEWTERLQRAGKLPPVDTSERACLLLAVTEYVVLHAPAWVLQHIAAVTRVPEKAKSNQAKLHRWIFEHWHKEHVREALFKTMGERWLARVYRNGSCHMSPTVIEHAGEKARQAGVEHMIWVTTAGLAMISPEAQAWEMARDSFGVEVWDHYLAELQHEAAPVLWYLMMKP